MLSRNWLKSLCFNFLHNIIDVIEHLLNSLFNCIHEGQERISTMTVHINHNGEDFEFTGTVDSTLADVLNLTGAKSVDDLNENYTYTSTITHDEMKEHINKQKT